MSKFSNKSLLLLLLLLGAVLAAVKFFNWGTPKNSEIGINISVDSSKVSTILIYPKSKKGEEVKLYKDGDQWKVRINENKSQAVEASRIENIIKTITALKADRLAGTTSDKWKDLEVTDSLGSRVKILEGEKTTLDIIIGKFNFSGTGNNFSEQNFESFVRLNGEDESYAVKGFLEGTFNTGIDAYRDKTIIKGNKDNWTKLTFALADTMRYFLEKRDSLWLVDGVTGASEALNGYLTTLASLNATSFIDDADAAGLGAAPYTLEIDDTQGNKIKVEGFEQDARKIIRSSMNTDLLNGDGVWEKIFADKLKFIPVDTLVSVK